MDQVYTADYDTSRFEQGSKRIDAASARNRDRVTRDFGVMGRSAEQFGKKILAGGAIAAGFALATASVRAFAETSEDGAAKVKALSDAKTSLFADIGRDIAADGFRDVISNLKTINEYRQIGANAVSDVLASIDAGENAWGQSARMREGELASERRAKLAKAEAEQVKELAEQTKRFEEVSRRISGENALAGLEGRAREWESARQRYEERARMVGESGGTAEQRAALMRSLYEAGSKEAAGMRDRYGREDMDAAERERQQRERARKDAADLARDAEDAAVERQLSAFGANNATRTAARLAEFRLRAERELDDLAARGAGEGALARLRDAQGADERGLVGALLRGMAESERGSSVSLAGRGGVAGLAGQVFGPAERTKEQKDEERARRLEAMVKSLIDEVKGVRRNTEDEGAVVGVFGA